MVGAPQRAHVSAALLVLAIEELIRRRAKLYLGPHDYQATSQMLPVAHGVEGQWFTNSLVVATTTEIGVRVAFGASRAAFEPAVALRDE
jgi:hypothetical protein